MTLRPRLLKIITVCIKYFEKVLPCVSETLEIFGSLINNSSQFLLMLQLLAQNIAHLKSGQNWPKNKNIPYLTKVKYKSLKHGTSINEHLS